MIETTELERQASDVTAASALRAHITVVESVIHQTPGEQPTMTESRFTRWLETTEQPFLRKFAVGPAWQKLEIGWLPKAGMLVLANLPERYLRMPTDERKQEDAAKVVEVAFQAADAGKRDMHSPPKPVLIAAIVVPPGESCRFAPADAATILVRCQSGEVKCALTLLPE